MTKGVFTVKANEKLTADVFKMVLLGDTSAITAPGQFVNIALDGLYLRRPISVCDLEDGALTIIYKTVGRGTEIMSRLSAGARLNLLTGLGNGYDLALSDKNPLLIGGGVGAPPLYLLAKRLAGAGKIPKVILGFNTASEVFLENEFHTLDIEVYITTIDGSLGIKGYVTDAFSATGIYDYIYVCGPEAMLKAVYIKSSTGGQFSFEEHMGCGFGACMGCSCETKYGYKRICREGPVLTKEEIVW